MTKTINDFTIGEIKEVAALLGLAVDNRDRGTVHPFIGKRVLVRTYSAGVHIGRLVWVNPENAMECKLDGALRLWKWEGGGLSLSAVANKGIVKGRLNRTGKVMLTNAVEYIPTNDEAEKSFEKFIED